MPTAPIHAKRCLADFIREMSGTYAAKDITPIASIARGLRRATADEVHGYFVEDGNTVVFTGTDGSLSYELRIQNQPIQSEVEPEANVVPFPRRRPFVPMTADVVMPEAEIDRLEAILQAEIEKRGETE
ncbi:hypothetical protein G6L68_25450 [Agrobacterium fabrum]|uniref:hypothetical protein n=1 Tax=Agrobacterium fabrum TaxID=1176649 RepID=UPI000EF58CA9|nr:hypothetical protein [Agrobacterium fabrum]AYM66133.1 hypothetical protein At12D13_49810 [Agrobacterium fabrum]NTE63981.1 hypothetical protein [Agrobacterium fabrum]